VAELFDSSDCCKETINYRLILQTDEPSHMLPFLSLPTIVLQILVKVVPGDSLLLDSSEETFDVVTHDLSTGSLMLPHCDLRA